MWGDEVGMFGDGEVEGTWRMRPSALRCLGVQTTTTRPGASARSPATDSARRRCQDPPVRWGPPGPLAPPTSSQGHPETPPQTPSTMEVTPRDPQSLDRDPQYAQDSLQCVPQFAQDPPVSLGDPRDPQMGSPPPWCHPDVVKPPPRVPVLIPFPLPGVPVPSPQPRVPVPPPQGPHPTWSRARAWRSPCTARW